MSNGKNSRQLKYFACYISHKRKVIIGIGILAGLLLGGFRVVRGILLWDTQMEGYLNELAIYEDRCITYQQEVEAYNEIIDELQRENEVDRQELLQAQNARDSLVEPSLPTNRPTIKHSIVRVIEFTLIGVFLGVFSIICVYACIYERKGIMYSIEEFKGITGIYVLGTFDQCKKNKYKQTDIDIYDRIGMHIQSKKDSYSRIIFTGLVNGEVIERIVTEVEQHCNGIEVISENSIPAEIRHMALKGTPEAVILIEKREESLYPDIFQEVERLKVANKIILGAVIL